MTILPQNKRREIARPDSQGLRIWLYAGPYVGKTTFADQFPDPINLNTDGNIKFVTMPYVTISPDSSPGMTAWQFFKATIDALLKGDHTYKTIVVDLLEDIYQYARDHHNAAQGWLHESEPGFAKGYDLIRNDFLGELKRLATSGYNVVFLSHQTDRVVKSRTGRESTLYQPNLSEKVAIKVSGLVDITARAFMDVKENEDGSVEDVRLIQLKPTVSEFNAGGRVSVASDTVALDYDEFMAALDIKVPKAKPKRDLPEEKEVVKPARKTRAKKSEETVPTSTADRTSYIKIGDEVVMVQEGEEYPEAFVHGAPGVEMVPEETYLEYINQVAVVEKVEEEVAEEAPRRRRRTRQLT